MAQATVVTKELVLSSLTKSTRDGEYRINCIYCDDDSFHMYCNLSKMVYHCFKCEAKGKIISMKGTDTLEGFARAVGTVMDNVLEKQKYKTKDFSVPIIVDKREVRNLPLSVSMDGMYGTAVDYLRSRGLSHAEMIENCRVSIEKSGPYKDTVIFPIYDGPNPQPNPPYEVLDVRPLKYFVCRRYTDQQPKYINAPWPKDDTLFIEKRTDQRYATGVIVEGIFDALALGRAGFLGISILGKSVTSKQLLRLKKLCEFYVIYLDDDAFTHGIKLKMQLDAIGKPAVLIHHDKDASDAWQHDPEELKKMVRAGIHAVTNKKS